MNEITINNHVIPIKEYNGQRVVTFKDIDTVHDRADGTARKRFNDNRNRFIEGVDYFVRISDEAKNEYGIIAPNGLVLITESGYLMLVKSFTDDLAWQVQRELVNSYFRMKEISKTPDVRNRSTRPLTSDDYMEAAKTISKCRNSRLPIVIDLYRKAGLEIADIPVEHDTVDGGADTLTDDVDLIELLSGFSLTELCVMLNLPKSTVYYYQSGKTSPRPKRKRYIIKKLSEIKSEEN